MHANSVLGGTRCDTRHVLRRTIALVIIVLTLAGCSRTVEIPLDRIGEPEWRKPGNYRLRLLNGDQYYARRFLVSDSTVIVTERTELDEDLYGNLNLPPKSIPIDELRNVEKIESRTKVLALYCGIVGAIIGGFAWLAGGESDP